LPVIASPTVPAKRLIMFDAANFASGDGDEPDIASSKEVLLHEEDTAPIAIASRKVRLWSPHHLARRFKPIASPSG
jgi:hypothetical protein